MGALAPVVFEQSSTVANNWRRKKIPFCNYSALAPAFFPTVLKCPKIAGANSLFFKIAGAKAPIAPVLNTPLSCALVVSI